MEYATRRRITAVEEPSPFVATSLRSSHDSELFVRQFWHEDITLYESFFVAMLDASNTAIAYAKISQGAVNHTAVDPRIICKLVVDHLAVGVVLCHNHPSGNLKPSEADCRLTQKVANCLQYFDVKIIDHLIITSDQAFSFASDERYMGYLKPKLNE